MDLTAALSVPLSAARPRFDRESGRLLGSRCANCEARAWPMRAVCHRCGAAAPEATAFPAEGMLLSYTIVCVAPAELNPPYTIGQVRLEGGPLVFGHVRRLPGGARVPLAVRLAFASDEASVPPFWFEPEAGE